MHRLIVSRAGDDRIIIIVLTNEKLFSSRHFAITVMYFLLRTNPLSTYSFPVMIFLFFWKHVLSWLRDNDVEVGELNESDLIFGKFDVQDDVTLINHILLLGKYYIYSRKCQNAKPFFQGFITQKSVCIVQGSILPGKWDTLSYHWKKWEKLIRVLVN